MTKHTTTVTLVNKEACIGTDPPEKLTELRDWITSVLSEIPAEFHDSARMEIGTYGSYGDTYSQIEVYYERPETEAEQRDREAEELRYHESRKAHDLKVLAELQKRYGKQSP
jgi:hypothetical protein